MRGSEIQQAKMAAWILGGVEDRGEERPWFRFPNPAQEKDGAGDGQRVGDLPVC